MTITEKLLEVSKRLKTQDNRSTSNPMFCVRKKVRDVWLDANYATGRCWHEFENMETVYDDDANFKEPEGSGWEEFGYVDRWETVMVAFTEGGCKEYLEHDGHNVKRSAFRGVVNLAVNGVNESKIQVVDPVLCGLGPAYVHTYAGLEFLYEDVAVVILQTAHIVNRTASGDTFQGVRLVCEWSREVQFYAVAASNALPCSLSSATPACCNILVM